jgi:hypothetical protein
LRGKEREFDLLHNVAASDITIASRRCQVVCFLLQQKRHCLLVSRYHLFFSIITFLHSLFMSFLLFFAARAKKHAHAELSGQPATLSISFFALHLHRFLHHLPLCLKKWPGLVVARIRDLSNPDSNLNANFAEEREDSNPKVLIRIPKY